MGKTQGKKKGGAKKIGRNVEKCKCYRDLGIREKNKRRKARKEEVKKAKLERKRARRALKKEGV